LFVFYKNFFKGKKTAFLDKYNIARAKTLIWDNFAA